MKHWFEILIFVTLAIALHVLAFAQGSDSSQQAGGSGGDAMVSIQAAPPTMVELVESWERPPVTPSELPNTMTAPQPAPVEAPVSPQIELSPAPRAALRMAVVQPEIEDPVDVDTTPPPPPPPPEPKADAEAVPDTRPKPRPEKQQPKEALKADQASDGRNEEVAAGSGASTQAGAGSANVTTGDPGRTAKLQAVWGAKIRARIDRSKRYPRGSKASGSVTIQLQVSRDGRLVSYRLRNSSGIPELDNAALQAVARAKRFPKAPKELIGNSFNFSVAIKLSARR